MRANYNKIFLSEIEGELDEDRNVLPYEGKIYNLKYLNPGNKSSKGGNSSVFILYDRSGEEGEQAIKISNYHKLTRTEFKKLSHKRREWHQKRYARFINEIEVLNQMKERDSAHIVRVQFDGMISIGNKEFPYFVMEKADTDLKEYISTEDVDEQQKFEFCNQIFQSIKDLDSQNLYHRDIKPDNVLLFKTSEDEGIQNYTWKIGDLGLASSRDSDYDDIGEKIGPIGWMSPESANKFLTEKYETLDFDCIINNKSDIFQLGKLFWYIFIGNIPIGLIRKEDFKKDGNQSEYIFELICSMLQHNKERRISMDDLQEWLSILSVDFGL